MTERKRHEEEHAGSDPAAVHPLGAGREKLLRLHGSNTIGEKLAPVLAEKWLKSKGYTEVTIRETGAAEKMVTGRDAKGRQFTVEVVAHGSSTAFTDLAAGSADVGMASRPVKPQEVSELTNLGKLDDVRSEYVIGLDGVRWRWPPMTAPPDAIEIAESRYGCNNRPRLTDWSNLQRSQFRGSLIPVQCRSIHAS